MPPSLLLRSALLGVVAGLRSQFPAAALAVRGFAPASRPLALISTPGGRRGAYLAAAGEILVDKLPVTPDRVEPRGLAARAVSGSIAGAVLASAAGVRGVRLAFPVAVGAAAAYLGSWGGFSARRALVNRTGLPDPVVAVAEDVVAVGLAAVAVHAPLERA